MNSILLIRSDRVMLDSGLTELYEVETGALTRAVRRSIGRFPPDFMFQLTRQEFEDLKRQSGISSGWGGRRRRRRHLLNRALPCSPACCTANEPFRSTSKSCGLLFICVRCCHLMPTWADREKAKSFLPGLLTEEPECGYSSHSLFQGTCQLYQEFHSNSQGSPFR